MKEEKKKISDAEVEHIARLARLGLTEADKEKFSRQLDDILRYMEKLDELDTAGVEPLTHVLPLKNVLRKDEPRAGLTPDEILPIAPERSGNLYKVPPVIE